MMEEYLNKLRTILSTNHYEDVENTVEFYREMIMDKMENGESEEDVLEEIGSVEKLASTLLGKTVKEDDLGNNEMQYIHVEMKNIDCSIEAAPVSEMVIDAPNEDFVRIENDGNTLYISQVTDNKIHFFFNKDLKVRIQIPEGRCLQRIYMKGISSDFSLEGNLECHETQCTSVSGDNKVKKIQGSHMELFSTSGDCKIKDCSLQTGNIQSVSGDIKVRNVTGKTMRADTVSGDIKAQEIGFEKTFMKSTSGDIVSQFLGDASEYTIHMRKQDIGNGQKIIEMKTVSGDVEYSFCK